MKHFLAALLVLVLAGCGTLFIPANTDVTVHSNPVEATVTIDGVDHGTTPVTLNLNNKKPHTIIISKPGYDSVTCQLNTKIKGSVVVLDVLGGLLPVVVDAATGGWKKLEKTECSVQLREQ